MDLKKDRKWMELTILVAWIAFFGFVLLTHRLPLYINPKFTMLPILASLILLGMVLASIFGKGHDAHEHPVGWASGSWNMLPIILGIVIAPASLGSFVAGHRGGISTGGAGNTGIMLNLASAGDYQDVDVRQLANAGHISKGKVCVEGQIPDDGGALGKTSCPLIHYVMTCCVEDLQTVGVTMNYPAGFKPTAGQWVRVRGTADRTPTGVVVTADTIEPIDQPDPPYLY